MHHNYTSSFVHFQPDFSKKKKKHNYTSDVCHSVQWWFLLGEKANPLLLCPCLCSQQLIIVRRPLVVVLPVPHHSRQPLAHQGLRDVAARKAISDDVSSCVIMMPAIIMKIIHTSPPTPTGCKLSSSDTSISSPQTLCSVWIPLSVSLLPWWNMRASMNCVCVCVCVRAGKTLVYHFMCKVQMFDFVLTHSLYCICNVYLSVYPVTG